METRAERFRPHYLTDTPLDAPTEARQDPGVRLNTASRREAMRQRITAAAQARHGVAA